MVQCVTKNTKKIFAGFGSSNGKLALLPFVFLLRAHKMTQCTSQLTHSSTSAESIAN